MFSRGQYGIIKVCNPQSERVDLNLSCNFMTFLPFIHKIVNTIER